MADSYGMFWNSRGGDRTYSADSMEEWLKPFFVTGVFNGELAVTATTGMTISVAPGYCNINGKVRYFDTANTFTLATAGVTSNRVDTVVIERNDGDRAITLKVITGTPGGGATPPVREDGVYQLVIAQIAVAAGAVEILQSNITDTRMSTNLCGYVVSTVEEIDFDSAYAQFTAWFNEYKQEIIHDFDDAGAMAQLIFDTWFQHMKDQLDSDAAGHLQLEIDALSPKIDGFEDCMTVFNQDGSITSTYSDRIKHTVFNADGSITETLANPTTQIVYSTKKTTFLANGNIKEEML